MPLSTRLINFDSINVTHFCLFLGAFVSKLFCGRNERWSNEVHELFHVVHAFAIFGQGQIECFGVVHNFEKFFARCFFAVDFKNKTGGHWWMMLEHFHDRKHRKDRVIMTTVNGKLFLFVFFCFFLSVKKEKNKEDFVYLFVRIP